MAKGDSQRIRELLIAQHIEPARQRGQKTVRVVSGDLARALGLRNRHAQICTAMRAQRFLRDNGLEIAKSEGPPSQESSTVVITYRLLNGERPGQHLFDALYGRFREMYAAEGGGEASLRRDRATFEREPEQ